MEQAQYWMWMKRRQVLKSDFRVCRSSINDSWEERAFAEDASGNLGGCIWPPRSYSCSFCKREFRSAQALGGHMNVHRRDRARLKQFDPQNNTQSLDSNFPDEVSSLDLRVSGLSDHTNFVSSHPPSIVEEIKRNSKPETKKSREETYDDDDEFVETDLLIGFNNSAGDHNMSCKRAKKTGVSAFSLLIKQPCLNDRYIFKPEIRTEAVSEIDLELRLG